MQKRRKTQSTRSKRRTVKAVGKRAAQAIVNGQKVKLDPELELDPQVQAAKIVALESSLEHLVKAQQENHQALHKAFQMTDAHLWVLNRLCRDIVTDNVIKLDNGMVDMSGYFDLFNANQRLQAEQAKIEAEKQRAEAEEAERASKPDEPEVFGGDAVNAGA